MKLMLSVCLFFMMLDVQAIETCDKGLKHGLTETAEDVDFALSETNQAEIIWQDKLAKYILQVGDSDLKVLALSQLDLMSLDADEPFDESLGISPKESLNVLNQIVTDDNTATQTLLIARSICHDLNTQVECDDEKFSHRLLQQAPDNINVYLPDLEQAVNNSDAELVTIILKQMSLSKNSQSLLPLPAELITMVDDFMFENPITAVMDEKIIERLPVDLELTEAEVEFYIKQNTAQMYYISGVFMHMPALRPLLVACEEFQSDPKLCKRIAETLKHNSDTTLMTIIGYSLDEKLEMMYGNNESLELIKAENETFKSYQSCLLKNHALLADARIEFEPEFVQIMTQGGHEGRNLEQAAMYLYTKYNKVLPEKAVNPQSCGLRYIEPS